MEEEKERQKFLYGFFFRMIRNNAKNFHKNLLLVLHEVHYFPYEGIEICVQSGMCSSKPYLFEICRQEKILPPHKIPEAKIRIWVFLHFIAVSPLVNPALFSPS